MFNGIIHNNATVEKISSGKHSLEIVLKTNLAFRKSDLGASLCCNGACLTITGIKKNLASFYLSKETLNKTNFKYIRIGNTINIEKSLKMLKKANKLRPNDGYIIDSLGWTLFKLKNYQEAKKYLEVAIRYMAADPVVNDHYADALWMNNKSLQARYYWNYVLKLEKTEEKLKKEIKKKLLFGLKS